MRVVFAEHVADHARTFDVGPVPNVVGLVHGEQDAAMYRFQAVTDIGERPPHDHAHRVIEVRAAHLLFEANRKRFFGELIHQSESVPCCKQL